MEGKATLATERFKLATAAAKIRVASTIIPGPLDSPITLFSLTVVVLVFVEVPTSDSDE